ncbi:MAG: biotin/lipoyl-containing protein [Balneola sp.]|jgi:acetyl/propionyl-CoA carboxylase alpha subunit|uniref:biotin/lipoyl-containing protein n=1 Tax=Balneola sp. EhC07 TaxID=1849360 RepID=UPI0007F4E563|nr:biotin/lipoyl-containing protein [Balneola sp. EhC07]OAN64676.1 acetyl-CoA carboxylase biotin carboxyl carrier protein subunit [Balneola sp. EhC07]
MKFEARVSEEPIEVDISEKENSFKSGDLEGEYEFISQNGRYLLRIGTKLYKIDNVSYDGSDIEFSVNGDWFKVSVKDEQELLLDRLGFKTGNAVAEGSLKSPMPGKILDILVSEGDEVTKGQPVVILEAMKMENELKAAIDGTIASISVEVGQSLEKNSPILEIENIG